MSGKIFIAVIGLLLPSLGSGELIKVSEITDFNKLEVKIIRDIFSPRKMTGPAKLNSPHKNAKLTGQDREKKEEKVEDKVIATVFYEGFLLKGDRKYALLKVNGQYYISGEGDRIPGSILLKRILEKKVLLEIESSEITITKKGERNVN